MLRALMFARPFSLARFLTLARTLAFSVFALCLSARVHYKPGASVRVPDTTYRSSAWAIVVR